MINKLLMTRMNFFIPAPLKAAIEAYAQHLGVPVAEVVRDALMKHVGMKK